MEGGPQVYFNQKEQLRLISRMIFFVGHQKSKTHPVSFMRCQFPASYFLSWDVVTVNDLLRG
jgi:hypothetical protein